MSLESLSRPEVIPPFMIDGFIIREAKKTEMDEVYLMGIDVWGQNSSLDEYMNECRGSIKYQKGIWYIIEHNHKLVSSMIIYNLPSFDRLLAVGIGSLATKPDERMHGYSSRLFQSLIEEYQKKLNISAFVLYAEINTKFYERFGFQAISQSLQKYSSATCMIRHIGSENFRHIEKLYAENSICYF